MHRCGTVTFGALSAAARCAPRARANGGALRRRRIRASARPAVAAARAAAIHFAVQKALIVAVAAC
ncbi:hypothetical protein AQ911_10445 [Burkholderia pseudomallei]|nr:hypothetical protein AQ911_10445 [Burkholderia pseudomallei]